MTGLDTGFFVKLLQNDNVAVQVWSDIIEGKAASVSCLTLYELQKLALKGSIDRESADILISGITAVCLVLWLDSQEVLMRGAGLSHGLGIPAVDSLILAGFELIEAETIYTTDSHFERYTKEGRRVVKFHLLPKSSS